MVITTESNTRSRTMKVSVSFALPSESFPTTGRALQQLESDLRSGLLALEATLEREDMLDQGGLILRRSKITEIGVGSVEVAIDLTEFARFVATATNGLDITQIASWLTVGNFLWRYFHRARGWIVRTWRTGEETPLSAVELPSQDWAARFVGQTLEKLSKHEADEITIEARESREQRIVVVRLSKGDAD